MRKAILPDNLVIQYLPFTLAINGQNAAWKTPRLSEPYIRARGGIIQDLVDKTVPTTMAPPPTPPLSPRKVSQDELDVSLRNIFVEQIKISGPPPDFHFMKSLLERGANPNIKIPQSKHTRDRSNNHYQTYSNSNNNAISGLISSSPPPTPSLPSYKLPNVLFAAIALSDDPRYVMTLINYGAETMPRDNHFPNAFVFAARYQRVETMKCLLENVPALSDPESVDAAIRESGGLLKDPTEGLGGNGTSRDKSYAKLWSGFTGEMKKLMRGRQQGHISD